MSAQVQVQEGQVWASLHGGIYDLFEVIKVLMGRYLRPPDVAIVPCEFVRIRYLTGSLKTETLDQRTPYHKLGGDGHHRLYRNADGTLTEWGAREERRTALYTELREIERRAHQIRRELGIAR